MASRRDARAGRRRAGRKRVGSTVIFALTVLTPVMLASGTILSQLHAYADEVDRRIYGVTAQLVAASGAHEGLATLTLDPAFRGTFEVQLNGGRAAVEVTQVAGEETLDVADDLVQVRSEGWLNGPAEGAGGLPRDGVLWFRSVVNATARPRLVPVPINQTLFVGDPAAQVLMSGTTFRVAGEDSAADPEPTLPGIGVAGDPLAFTSQIPPSLQSYITGAEADTVASVRASAPVDVAGWIERFRSAATIVWTATNQRLDAATLGTDAAPVVAFAEGSLNIRGNVAGRGVLVVREDLRVTGTLDFAGIIVVGGGATFRGMAPERTRHRGALLIEGTDLGRDLEIAGDVQLLYDSSAVSGLVGQFFDGVEVVTWDHDLDAGLAGGAGGGDPP